MKYIDKGEAWLYRFVDGEVKEFHGRISAPEEKYQFFSSVTKGGYIFESDDGSWKWNVAINEGVVYLNSAWLREQDKEKAVELFHEYKRGRFIRMFSKLQNYYTDMCILEDIHNGLEV